MNPFQLYLLETFLRVYIQIEIKITPDQRYMEDFTLKSMSSNKQFTCLHKHLPAEMFIATDHASIKGKLSVIRVNILMMEYKDSDKQ